MLSREIKLPDRFEIQKERKSLKGDSGGYAILWLETNSNTKNDKKLNKSCEIASDFHKLVCKFNLKIFILWFQMLLCKIEIKFIKNPE